MSGVRIGLIGCGGMGTELGRNVGKEGPPASVVAACDILEDRRNAVSTELGAIPVASADELLAREDVDAVIVAVPNYLHSPIAVAAAKAGKHVYSEKPMSLFVEDCTAMIDACKAAGVKLMVGHVLRYIGAFRLAADHVRKGDIGEPGAIAITRIGTLNYGGAAAAWRNKDETSGGFIFEVHVHELDYMRSVMGEPEEVYSSAAKFVPRSDGDFEDIQSVTAWFEKGRIAQLLAGNSSPASMYSAYIHGSEGEIVFNGWSGITLRRFDEEAREISAPENAPNPVAEELGDFVTSIVTGCEPAVPGEEGRRSVAYARAAVMSARERRPVRISELLP